ncbi:unnamed protein product [Urochloa decumbens]|uniref:Agenet domain-containing protein n=1 Tax=Urochloa decumbens TaxID=240449 RepID=A0ABC9B282_9POAL
MAASAAAGGSSSRGTKRRRRKRGGARWSKTPRKPSPPTPTAASSPSPDSTISSSSPPPARDPLPAGAKVEVRDDKPGYFGSWFEATVVGFSPARGPRAPARYAVTYEHILDDDGGGVLSENFTPSHVRPRPPPSPTTPAAAFRPNDIVEAFHNDGWWSGIVVSSAGSPGAVIVTVAFPITREVIRFPPRHVRPRRDYVDGEWVPSRVAMVVRPKRALKVYGVGEKVEVGRDRPRYGYSWFPATVLKVIDDLSYIVEYIDLEEEGEGEGRGGAGGPGKATEYLHWRFIRPAVEHVPRESEFQLGPGAAVEAYCDGAWSPGVVRSAVGDGEFEVAVVGKKTELLVTKVVELLKPQYKWNGKYWKIVAAKRRANLRRRSMLGQNPSSPVDLSSSGDDYSHDPESVVTKKSRKTMQQHAVVLATNSEHASVSEMDTPLSTLCESPEGNHSGSRLSDKNCLQVTSPEVVSSVPMYGHHCTSPGHSTPQNGSIPNATGETLDNQETPSEMMDSNGHVDTHVYGASAEDAHDMLSIAELKKRALARRNRPDQRVVRKVLSAKTLRVKKGISKSKGDKTHPIQEFQGKYDTPDNIQLKGNINLSSKDIVCALSVSVEDRTTKTPDRQTTRQTRRGSSSKVLACKKLAKKKGARELGSPISPLDVTSTVQLRGRKKVEQIDKTFEDTVDIAELSDQDMVPRIPPGFESMYDGKGVDTHGGLSEEPPAMVNSISQVNINADVSTDRAATQVAKSNHHMETATLSVDHTVQEAAKKVDERSTLSLRNAGSSEGTMNNLALRSCSASGSSMPSHFLVSQGHHVPFVKSSSMWPLLEALDAFKIVPQRPHFLPLRQYQLALREGMALGMMSSFAELVNDTMEASIDHSTDWFEDKIGALSYLQGNGFDVQFFQSTLTKLLHMKSDGTSYLGEIQKLDSQIVGKTASSSQIDALLDEKDRAIAELEQKLGRLRQESQKIAKYKEHEDAELLELQSVRSRFKEAYSDVKRQFHNTMAEMHQKKLTLEASNLTLC